jgi:hypothetical protein
MALQTIGVWYLIKLLQVSPFPHYLFSFDIIIYYHKSFISLLEMFSYVLQAEFAGRFPLVFLHNNFCRIAALLQTMVDCPLTFMHIICVIYTLADYTNFIEKFLSNFITKKL